MPENFQTVSWKTNSRNFLCIGLSEVRAGPLGLASLRQCRTTRWGKQVGKEDQRACQRRKVKPLCAGI